MNTEAAFLASIAANLDDDAPRLIFADWLEEHGESERAELIRVQCELARIRRIPCGGYYCDESVGHIDCEDPTGERTRLLWKRERELLCRHFDDWSNLPPDPHGDVWDMQNFDDGDPESEARLRAWFRRGFVERVTVRCHYWLTHGPAILAAVPTLREVRISDKQPLQLNQTAAPLWIWVCYPQDFYATNYTENYLREELFRDLPPESFGGMNACSFSRRDDALAALSLACLVYARRRIHKPHGHLPMRYGAMGTGTYPTA